MPSRPHLQYGWRPATEGQIQHCVLPGVEVVTIDHHAIGAAWDGNNTYLCDGPRPNQPWQDWDLCEHCAPGYDRYVLLSALVDAHPQALASSELEVIRTVQPTLSLLEQLLSERRLIETLHNGTLLYRATPAALADWGR